MERAQHRSCSAVRFYLHYKPVKNGGAFKSCYSRESGQPGTGTVGTGLVYPSVIMVLHTGYIKIRQYNSHNVIKKVGRDDETRNLE